jgi:hypothetical protein
MADYDIAEEENVRVSEFKYSHENGVDVRIIPKANGTYEVGGCQWPAEWLDTRMGENTYSEEQVGEWKDEARRAAYEIVDRYNE